MLLQKEYEVLITNRNISRFRNKYIVKSGEYTMINVNDLSKGSHLKVDIECDICLVIFKRPYKEYLYRRESHNYDTCNKCKYVKVKETNVLRYNVLNTFQSKENKEKMKETWLAKYGVDNPAKSEEVQSKIRATNLEKYGSEYGLSNKKVRELISETKTSRGLQRPSDKISEYERYRNLVDNKTKLLKSPLLESWDGLDYYDGEYIKDNFDLHHNNKNYPTIDHKISVLNGFINGMRVDEIACISNLCITKRIINSSKGSKNESKFKGID